jgi:amino acid transporter
MKRPCQITTKTLLASCIAGIVGSGWLLGPMVCAQIAGPASIVSWVIAGLLMMLVASTFVQLASIQPTTGGTVRYFQMHYGHFAGFAFSLITWLAWVAVAPIETMALIQYSANYMPSLMTTGPMPVLSIKGMLVAMASITLMTYINNKGISVVSVFNHVIVCFKLLIPIVTVVLLFSHHSTSFHAVQTQGFMPYGVKSIFEALPMAGVIYSFIGFNPAIQLSAELATPKRSLPIAVFGALLICMLLYTLIQIAFIVALPASSLAKGWGALHFTGATGPFAGLLAMMGFVFFVKMLYADAIISPFGTGVVQSMATSRMTVAMAANTYFPRSLMRLNQCGSPTRAMIVNMVMGYMFFLPFPSWQKMVVFLSSCLVMGYVVGPMSLMIANQGKNSFRHSIQGVVALTVCSCMIYWSGWAVVSKIAMVFAAAYVILWLKVCFAPCAEINRARLHIKRGLWVIIYMVGLSIISYCGTFAGRGFVPFGVDIALLLMLSALVYLFAAITTQQTSAPQVCEFAAGGVIPVSA